MAVSLGGGGGDRSGEFGFNAEINVTSLVDVVLVLLIIFMLAAPLMQGGVDVELPKAAEAKPLTAKQGLVVVVDRRGRIFIDETPVTYEDFRGTFAGLVAARNPEGVYLRGDAGVPYGDIVRVLAVIRASGVQNVGLVAQDEGERGGR